MGAEPRPVDDRWLALLVEASADVVAVLDDSAVLLYANPAAETLFGYDLDARRGQSVVDLLHPDDLGLALGSLDSMLTRTDRPGEPIEVRVRTERGLVGPRRTGRHQPAPGRAVRRPDPRHP